MSRLIQILEVILVPTMALISLLIAIADFLGLLNTLPWISIRIPTIILLITALALSSLSIMQNKFTTLQRDVQSILSHKELGEMRKSLEQIDPNLLKVFEDDILELLGSLELAIKENTFRLNDLDRFRYYYNRSLQKYRRATFLSTSLPSSKYFWKNELVEQATTQFIHTGGKMKRIFFLKGDAALSVPEVQEILTIQHEMGVEVYTTNSDTAPNELKKYFMVESTGKFAWEVFIDPEQRIKAIVATTNKQETQKYRKIIDQLLKEGETKRYIPPS